MIGKVEAFLDKCVDIDRPAFARTLTRMQQHALDDRIGALAMLHDLVEIALKHIGNLADLSSQLAIACRSSSISSTDTAEKLLTKLSGFLISCAMPAVS